jgi:hypothetical protein
MPENMGAVYWLLTIGLLPGCIFRGYYEGENPAPESIIQTITSCHKNRNL